MTSVHDRVAPPTAVYGILAAGLMSFSVSPILVRLAGDAPSISLVALRTVFSIFILAPFALRYAGKDMLELSKKEIGHIGIAGILLGVHFYFFFEAIRLSTVASATVLVTLSPIFLGILGFMFLRERLSMFIVGGIILSVTGGILIGVGDASEATTAINPIVGNLMAITACLLASVYLIIGRIVRQRISWLAYVFPLYTVASVSMIVVALITETPLLGLDARIYGLCLLMAIFPQIFGHGSFNYAVKYFPAAILGLLSLTEPIGSTVLAYFMFDEFPSVLSLVGMLITLVAVSFALVPGLIRKRE